MELGKNSSDTYYLSPQAIADLSGLSLSTVHRYLDKGKLPKEQPGGKRCRVLIPRDALESTNRNGESAGDTPTQLSNGYQETGEVIAVVLSPNKSHRPGSQPRWKSKLVHQG
jgi:excisionase family DNA binding protein